MKKIKVIIPLLALLFVSAILLGTQSEPKTTLNANNEIQASSSTSIAYICNPIYFTFANNFKTLLENNGYSVSIVNMSDVVSANFSSYVLIIIGPETDVGSSWGTVAQCAAVNNSGNPVLGLSRGGLAFFENISLDIGWGNSITTTTDSTNISNPSHQIFQTPNLIPNINPLKLTSSPNLVYGIFCPSPGVDIVTLGIMTGYVDYYSIIMQQNKYIMWGYQASPTDMTENGTKLFVNVVNYLAGSPGNGAIPGFEFLFILLSLIVTVVIIRKKELKYI